MQPSLEVSVTHILITLAVQLLVGLLFRNWLLGGVLMAGFYLGREVTQAEYRWISAFGDGLRANMPWWGGFAPEAWNWKSGLDALGPVIATLACFGLARSISAVTRR